MRWFTIRKNKDNWHLWFAWRPVPVAFSGHYEHTVDPTHFITDWVWLETVARQRISQRWEWRYCYAQSLPADLLIK